MFYRHTHFTTFKNVSTPTPHAWSKYNVNIKSKNRKSNDNLVLMYCVNKTYGKVEVNLRTFLTVAPDKGDCSDSPSHNFNPTESLNINQSRWISFWFRLEHYNFTLQIRELIISFSANIYLQDFSSPSGAAEDSGLPDVCRVTLQKTWIFSIYLVEKCSNFPTLSTLSQTNISFTWLIV
jgi:hypothetical protein